jgi:hypothetical protein
MPTTTRIRSAGPGGRLTIVDGSAVEDTFLAQRRRDLSAGDVPVTR